MTTVLIVGVPRSGTTWVGQALGHTDGAVYVNEPDGDHDPSRSGPAPATSWLRCSRAGEPAPEWDRLWAGSFAGGRYAGTPRDRIARALYARTPTGPALGGLAGWPGVRRAPCRVAPRGSPRRRAGHAPRRREVGPVGARGRMDRRAVPAAGPRGRAPPVQRARELDRARLRARRPGGGGHGRLRPRALRGGCTADPTRRSSSIRRTTTASWLPGSARRPTAIPSGRRRPTRRCASTRDPLRHARRGPRAGMGRGGESIPRHVERRRLRLRAPCAAPRTSPTGGASDSTPSRSRPFARPSPRSPPRSCRTDRARLTTIGHYDRSPCPRC